MTTHQRNSLIDKLVNFRMQKATEDRAIGSLLEDAFRYGRLGYDSFTDAELEEEWQEWNQEEVDAANANKMGF